MDKRMTAMRVLAAMGMFIAANAWAADATTTATTPAVTPGAAPVVSTTEQTKPAKKKNKKAAEKTTGAVSAPAKKATTSVAPAANAGIVTTPAPAAPAPVGVGPNNAGVSAGQVQYLSGTLAVQRADGSTRVLSQKSTVYPGDVLTTQPNSYAQVNFTDGSSMTIRPNTQMKIEAYQFKMDQPQNDNVFFKLLKGGLRTVTGLIGKRGNQDAYKIGTSTATIGIRGSSGDTLDCTQGCDGVVPDGGKLEHGVYHTTYTGSYVMQNGAGSQVVDEGQFGFVKDANTAPVLLPKDPGLQLENIPTLLGVKPQQGKGTTSSSSDNSECVVR